MFSLYVYYLCSSQLGSGVKRGTPIQELVDSCLLPLVIYRRHAIRCSDNIERFINQNYFEDRLFGPYMWNLNGRNGNGAIRLMELSRLNQKSNTYVVYCGEMENVEDVRIVGKCGEREPNSD